MTLQKRTLRTPEDILAAGLISPDKIEDARRVGDRYAIAISPAMQSLIDPTDPADAIARQFVPDVRELDHKPQELADPIGDNLKSPVKGLVHRYPDRVLLKIVGVCPVYCRFCFRREMVGPDAGETLTREEIAAALDYVRAHPEIWEVILTGGDPFMLSPERVREVTLALGAIEHVKILRWHTRVPVVSPERVTEDLVAALRASEKTVYVGLHANHPRELTPAAREAIARIADAGIPLVSQTVLLKGVNDSVETLEALMRGLVAARVSPYYLHHADLAPGTSHFRTTIRAGQALMRVLRTRLSGIAMPTYVLDLPGAYGKIPIGPDYLDATEQAGTYRVETPAGEPRSYSDTSDH